MMLQSAKGMVTRFRETIHKSINLLVEQLIRCYDRHDLCRVVPQISMRPLDSGHGDACG